MARQEAEEERKRNVLLTLMKTVKLEAQEQREAKAEDIRRRRERFFEQRKKGESSSVSVIATKSLERCGE
jgi:hypothetical protein